MHHSQVNKYRQQYKDNQLARRHTGGRWHSLLCNRLFVLLHAPLSPDLDGLGRRDYGWQFGMIVGLNSCWMNRVTGFRGKSSLTATSCTSSSSDSDGWMSDPKNKISEEFTHHRNVESSAGAHLCACRTGEQSHSHLQPQPSRRWLCKPCRGRWS